MLSISAGIIKKLFNKITAFDENSGKYDVNLIQEIGDKAFLICVQDTK